MYKFLSENDTSITDYQIYRYNNYSSSNISSVDIKALDGTLVEFDTTFNSGSDSKNSDGSYKRFVYDTIRQLYYETQSNYVGTIPTTIHRDSIQYIKRKLHNEIKVISIPHLVFGDSIVRNSFKLSTINATGELVYNGTFVGLDGWDWWEMGGSADFSYQSPGVRVYKNYSSYFYASGSLTSALIPYKRYTLSYDILSITGDAPLRMEIGGQEIHSTDGQSVGNVTVDFTAPSSSEQLLSLIGFTAFGIEDGTYYTDITIDNLSITRTEEHVIVDDGNYNLYDLADSSSYASGLLPQVGNIFYESGFIVLTNTGSYSGSDTGSYLDTISNFTLEFSGSQTIYEMEVICNIEESEYNYTTNPTAMINQSMSIYDPIFIHSGSFIGTSSYGSGPVTMSYAELDFRPYITGIGLYNDNNEMMAVAKFPRPVKKENYLDQGFILKIDM